MSADLYRAPALVLLVALVAVFGTLWFRKRDVHPPRLARSGDVPSLRRRQLLWLVGWMFAAIQLEMEVLGRGQTGIWLAVARGSMQLAALMFLGSLAPQNFSKRVPVLYVVAFGIPLILYSTAISLDPGPGTETRVFLLVCCGAALFVAARWSFDHELVPVWASVLFVILMGSVSIGLTVERHYATALALVHSGILLMTAYLFAAEFRRMTAGVVFTVGGLVGWAIPVLFAPLAGTIAVPVLLLRGVNLMQVISAVGMIVLVLEDELASNLASQLRDRRARLETEKYTELYLESMPFEESGSQYARVCETIVAASRFAQAAITLRNPQGCFRLAGHAGLDEPVTRTLDEVAHRTTDESVKEIRARKDSVQEIGSLRMVRLQALLRAGEELPPDFLEVRALVIHGRDKQLMGWLLLAGLRDREEPLLTEDILPLELLAARIGAAREHQLLVRHLTQAERLAGLGQLAGGVAHELNNPLTVVTGYAELLADSDDPAAREQASVIKNEARRMKLIIESLMRFRRASTGGRMPIQIGVLLADIDKLMRHDLEAAGMALELRVAPGLPAVAADGEQLRQVFVQIIRHAAASMRELPDGIERQLTVEALLESGRVQVTIGDTGRGFPEPSRAFDPFFTTRHAGEGEGLGLSICYSVIREHGGQISAVNLHPRGSVVTVELPAEEPQGTGESAVEDGFPKMSSLGEPVIR